MYGSKSSTFQSSNRPSFTVRLLGQKKDQPRYHIDEKSQQYVKCILCQDLGHSSKAQWRILSLPSFLSAHIVKTESIRHRSLALIHNLTFLTISEKQLTKNELNFLQTAWKVLLCLWIHKYKWTGILMCRMLEETLLLCTGCRSSV